MIKTKTIKESMPDILSLCEIACKATGILDLAFLHRYECGEHFLFLQQQGQDTGYMIFVYMAEDATAKMIGYKGNTQRIHYAVQVVTSDPGVSYYPDGSGQPPSEDYEDIAITQMPAQAIGKCIEVFVGNLIAMAIQADGEARQSKEEEEFWSEEAKA